MGKTNAIQPKNKPDLLSPPRKAKKPITVSTPSTSEPPAKKSRLEAEEDKTRRRRTLKHLFVSSSEPPAPHCCFCQDEQKEEDEPLKQCSGCKARYHITRCLRYKGDFARNIEKKEDWLCARCIHCSGCGDFIGDPANTECTNCCRAWHGVCAPKGHCPSEEFDSDWFCSGCCRQLNLRIVRSPHFFYQPQVPPKVRKSRSGNDKLEFEGDVEELTELINMRDFTWEMLNYEAGFSSQKPEVVVMTSPTKKSKKKKTSEAEADGNLVVPYDAELFSKSRSEAYPSTPSVSSTEQWLHFGTGKTCKAIYSSAYEEPMFSAPHLYACKFCLHTTHLKEDFVTHWSHCRVSHPPGNEIYRHEGVSFFEVDGAVQKKYCQDLCLLAKLFIASKTLYDEVETFIFYVLCEITTEGFVIVGYFSKEKNPSKNNNLSCLLVLPMVQKMGYGRLLIDMSYELSRLEHRVGHPEHPLSDLGILAYRGYWRSSLLCYLRSMRNADKVNLKDMCLATRIAQVDIVNQLMLDNLIVMKDGVHYVKIGKRALKFPLSQSRRRAVNRGKLVWAPRETNGVRLDPTKINTYV